MKVIFFLLLGLAVSFSVYADDNQPSMATIQTWWKTQSDEKMTPLSELFPIFLRNHEKAFLLEVLFNNRGRNFRHHVVMIRPQLKEMREVVFPVDKDIVVHDFNHDGVSEIESGSVGSGQGVVNGRKAIVQFKGWNPVILYQIYFYIGGYYGVEDSRYSAKLVSWKFVDINGDKVDDLIETVTIEKGRNDQKPIATQSKYKFVFRRNKFIKYFTYLKSIGCKIGTKPKTIICKKHISVLKKKT
jgi:hypothetical protein